MKKLIVMMLLILLLVACNTSENTESTEESSKEEMKEVKLVLDWTPNTNHTGLYVAQAEGFFEEEGLDVEIMLPGEAGSDQLVASGQADFGISAQEALTEARTQNIPIVSIAAIIQHNTSGFAAPKEKGITSPADFAGKTYGGWGAPIEEAMLEALMSEENASVDDVNIVNMGNTDFFTAVERDIDFAWIYYGWTGIEAELKGIELDMLYLTDYAEELDYYTPLITTNEKQIKENPELIRSFLAAVANGYNYAIENPTEAADILVEAVPDLDEELVHASQEWLTDRYVDDANYWGEQKSSVWENNATWMFEQGLIEKELDVEATFTNEYLPQ